MIGMWPEAAIDGISHKQLFCIKKTLPMLCNVCILHWPQYDGIRVLVLGSQGSMCKNKLSKIIFGIVLLTGLNAQSQEVTETLAKVGDEYLKNSDFFYRAHSNKPFVIRGLLSNYTTLHLGKIEEVIVVIAPEQGLRYSFNLVCPLGNLADRDYLDKLDVGKDEVVLVGTFSKNLAVRGAHAELGSGVVLEGVNCRIRN
jgi:hypothetical protein